MAMEITFADVIQKGKSGDAHSPETVYNCDDINECEADPSPCPRNSLCLDKQGGYECECSDGFKGDECIDIDECRNECFDSSQRYSDPCHDCTEHSSCTNLPGSFRCGCDTGYEKASDSTCVDNNECDETPCHPRAICENTMGSFTCKCDTGLRGNGIDVCLDINECDEGIHDCPKTSKCINNIGDYRCECNHGYDGEDCTGSTAAVLRH